MNRNGSERWGLASFVLLVMFVLVLLWSAATAPAQTLSPALKAQLDYYFKGPGASNAVTREMLRDEAVSLAKLDVDDIDDTFALRTWVTLNFAELADLLVYLKTTDVYGTNNPADAFSGVITNVVGTVTNKFRVEKGIIYSP